MTPLRALARRVNAQPRRALCRCNHTHSSAIPRVANDRRTAERAFALWLQSNGLTSGAQGHKFALRKTSDAEYELIANDCIDTDETVLSLPLALTLGVEELAEQRESKSVSFANLNAIIDTIPSEAAALWQLPLALRLLSERAQPRSFFSPYIELLPSLYKFVPIFYTREQLAALQYAPLQSQVQKRAKLLHTMSSIVARHRTSGASDPFNGVASIDAGLIGWALSSVTSRAFSFTNTDTHTDDQFTRRLLPLIDMANHSHAPAAKLSFTSTGQLTLTALRSIAKHESITISYGSFSNDLLLLNYGFVVDDNPSEEVQVQYNLDALLSVLDLIGRANNNIRDWHHRLIGQVMTANSERALIINRTSIDSRLTQLFNILLSEPQPLVSTVTDPYFTSVDHPRSQAVNAATKRYLELLLQSFPTTLTDDIKILSSSISGSGSSSEMSVVDVCLRYRIAKKRLLMDCIHRLSFS